MRTTIDLDDALLTRLRDEARREGISLRALLHRVLLRGLAQAAPIKQSGYVAPSYSMGRVREGFDLVKARWIADDLEDEEILRTMHEGR